MHTIATLLVTGLLLALAPTAQAGDETWTLIGPELSSSPWYGSRSFAASPAFASDRTIFVGAVSPHVYRSTDGGQTWDPTYLGSNVGLIEALAVSPDFASDGRALLGSGQGYRLYATGDSGETWSQVCTPGAVGCLPANGLWDLAFATPQVVFAASNGGVFTSTDGGATWSKGTLTWASNESFTSIAASPAYASDQLAFAGGQNFGAFRSTDGGATWSPASVGLPHKNGNPWARVDSFAFSPDFAVDTTLYAIAEDDLYRSQDAGDTWLPLAPPLSRCEDVVTAASAIGPPVVCVVGRSTYYGVACSWDYGLEWVSLPPVPGFDNATIIGLTSDFANDRTLYVGGNAGDEHQGLAAYTFAAPDGDGDGVPDADDLCPAVADEDQADEDGDFIGDACDPCLEDPTNDADGDGVCGLADGCPGIIDDQTDSDGDGVGDACDADRDGDGELGVQAGGSDCEGVALGELCNGIDDDCDGEIDEAPLGEGLTCDTAQLGVCGRGLSVCDAGAITCEPIASPSPESCNAIDDDCDGLVDEGVYEACYSGDPSTNDVGVCHGGFSFCQQGTFGPCLGEVTPGFESCNNLDDDCDGEIDEALTIACYTGPAGTRHVGACQDGVSTCSFGSWGSCQGQVRPTPETCNGIDDNCDYQVDGMTRPCYSGPVGTLDVGLCASGTETCTDGAYGACAGDVTPAAEVCNKLDDNCDGTRDEGMPSICFDLWVPTGPSLGAGGPTEAAGVRRMAASPEVASDQTLFVTDESGRVYRTTDRGDTWGATDLGLLGVGAWSLNALAVSPDFANDGMVIAASSNGYGFFVSHDGGETWQQGCEVGEAGCLPLNAHWDLAFSPAFADDGTIFEAGNGGAHVSYDGGATWTEIDTGYSDSFSSVAPSPTFATDQTLFLGGQNWGVYASTDAGATWTHSLTGLPPYSVNRGISAKRLFVAPDFSTSQEVLALIWRSGIYESSNAASSWAQLPSPSGSLSDFSVSPDDGDERVLAVAGHLGPNVGPGVQLSFDGGATWQALEPVRSFSGMTAVHLTRTLNGELTVWASGWTDSGEVGVYSYTLSLPDEDGDGVPDRDDVCPTVPDPDQLDSDYDGAGDLCDICAFDADDDADGDGLCADVDRCPADGAFWLDADRDGCTDRFVDLPELLMSLGLGGQSDQALITLARTLARAEARGEEDQLPALAAAFSHQLETNDELAPDVVAMLFAFVDNALG